MIDYTNVISQGKHNKLLQKIGDPPPKTKGFTPGLIVIVDDKTLQTISNLNYGDERIDYLADNDFIGNIITHYYVMYNEKRQICIMSQNCEEYLDDILRLSLIHI